MQDGQMKMAGAHVGLSALSAAVAGNRLLQKTDEPSGAQTALAEIVTTLHRIVDRQKQQLNRLQGSPPADDGASHMAEARMIHPPIMHQLAYINEVLGNFENDQIRACEQV